MPLLFAAIEAGRYMMYVHLIDDATRRGARLAAVGAYSETTAEVVAEVTRTLEDEGFDVLKVEAYRTDATGADLGDWTEAAFGEEIAVRAEVSYPLSMPSFGLLPERIELGARTIVRSEVD